MDIVWGRFIVLMIIDAAANRDADRPSTFV
jgi:hypothetical protein